MPDYRRLIDYAEGYRKDPHPDPLPGGEGKKEAKKRGVDSAASAARQIADIERRARAKGWKVREVAPAGARGVRSDL